MKNIFSIILLFLVINVYSQDYKTLIQNVPGKEKFPNASSINVYTKIDIDLNKDGSFTKHVYYIKKILTYKGKSRYSDAKLYYNANYEMIKLGECFSVRNGKKIEIPKEGIHDNEGYMSVVSPVYINSRQTVVNFPAIEPGDFIVVDYTITSKPMIFFSGIEHLQESNPYLKKDFSINVDKSLDLYFVFSKNNAKFTKSNNADKTVYKWTVENVPQIKDEINRPTYLITGNPVFYSIMTSWGKASGIIFRQLKSVNYDTKEVKELALKITSGQKNDLEKLQSIYRYMQENFIAKYSSPDDNYAPQNPSLVLSQKYGSVKELTVLYVAMARAAGVEVNTALYLRYGEVEEVEKVPIMQFVSKPVVEYKGMLIALNTNDLPFGYINSEKGRYISENNMSQIKKYQFNTKGMISRNIDIKVNVDGTADASFVKVLRGSEDYWIRRRFKNQTEKKRKIWFTSNLSDQSMMITSDPVFKNIKDPAQNTIISFAARIEHFGTKQNKYFYFKLPEPETADLSMSGNSRENPYEIDETISVVEKYVISNLPANTKVIKPASAVKFSYKVNGLEMYFKISNEKKDGKIIIKREIFIPKTIISAKDYHEFYEFVSKMQKPLNEMVFFEN